MLDFQHITVLPSLDIYPGGCEYRGKRAKLTPCQATFLTKLRDKVTVSHDALFNVVYAGAIWPDPEAIKNLACMIRKRLKPLGIAIENIRGYGYRIEYGA